MGFMIIAIIHVEHQSASTLSVHMEEFFPFLIANKVVILIFLNDFFLNFSRIGAIGWIETIFHHSIAFFKSCSDF